jgi:hypothetical protein
MDNEELSREPNEEDIINWPRFATIATIVIVVFIFLYWIIKVVAGRHTRQHEQPPLPRTLLLPVYVRGQRTTHDATAPVGSPPAYLLHDPSPLPPYEAEDRLRRHSVVATPLQTYPRASLQRRLTGGRGEGDFLFGSVQARESDVHPAIRQGRPGLENRASLDTLPLYEDLRPHESASGSRHSA